MAKALEETTGQKLKLQKAKMEELKAERNEEKKRLKDVAKKMRNEKRKRQRLMNRAKQLPTQDLLEVFSLRHEEQCRRVAAKVARENGGAQGEEAPAQEEREE